MSKGFFITYAYAASLWFFGKVLKNHPEKSEQRNVEPDRKKPQMSDMKVDLGVGSG